MPRSFPKFYAPNLECHHFHSFLEQLRMPSCVFSCFCYILGRGILSCHPSTPKLSNFPNFLSCESLHNTEPIQFSQFFELRKLAQHPNYPCFFIFGLAKTCKTFHNTKTINFPRFWICKTFHNTKTIHFSNFWTCKTFYNTRTIQFSPFLDLQDLS